MPAGRLSYENYPDVDEVLRLLNSGLDEILGEQLLGLYLTGSLSYGGFDPGSSDIDLLALLQRPITAAQRLALSALHLDLAIQQPKWAARLEISYLPRHLLASSDPPAQPPPYVNGGRMWDPDPRYGQEWTMNLFVLGGRGIALRGPAPADVVPDVSMTAMRAASLRSLHQDWAPLLDDATPLHDPHHQAYITLTLCRILHTAAWVRAAYPQWDALVSRGRPARTLRAWGPNRSRHRCRS
ncbi:MAG: hypothetical protein ABJB98_09590, partial [Actinomycetota bacterium]